MSIGNLRHTFDKTERLTSKKLIEELFQNGSSFQLYPFLIKIKINPQDNEPNQFLISVPKKKFKRAVHRNLIKRRIRECIRLNKAELYTISNRRYYLAIVYISNEIHEYEFLHNRLLKIFQRFPGKV